MKSMMEEAVILELTTTLGLASLANYMLMVGRKLVTSVSWSTFWSTLEKQRQPKCAKYKR